MASLRFILPALAIAGSAAAASCSVDSTTTIQNGGDARAIATCTTFSGSIAIATGTAENIDLSGIQEITGSLSAGTNSSLPGLISSTLQKIGDTFSLQSATLLSTLNMPSLNEVKSIDWNGLPMLQQLALTNGVQKASNLSIQNTQLGSLQGINLAIVDTVNIANNRFLTEINMQLGNISNSLTLASNGKNVAATFPNLIWANTLDINNVTTFDTPSLAYINSSIYLRSNYFTSYSAPNMTGVGENLVVVDCPYLNNLSFPQVKQVGAALTVANNTALKSINAFPQLANVNGALDFTGNFTNASLPMLNAVQGTFNVQSMSDITDTCNNFSKFQGGAARGVYYCNGTIANPTTSNGSSTGTMSGNGGKTSSGAAVPMQLPAMTGFLGLVAAIFGLL